MKSRKIKLSFDHATLDAIAKRARQLQNRSNGWGQERRDGWSETMKRRHAAGKAAGLTDPDHDAQVQAAIELLASLKKGR